MLKPTMWENKWLAFSLKIKPGKCMCISFPWSNRLSANVLRQTQIIKVTFYYNILYNATSLAACENKRKDKIKWESFLPLATYIYIYIYCLRDVFTFWQNWPFFFSPKNVKNQILSIATDSQHVAFETLVLRHGRTPLRLSETYMLTSIKKRCDWKCN